MNASAQTQRGITPKYVLRRMTQRQVIILKWKYYTKGHCTTCAAKTTTMKSKYKRLSHCKQLDNRVLITLDLGPHTKRNAVESLIELPVKYADLSHKFTQT